MYFFQKEAFTKNQAKLSKKQKKNNKKILASQLNWSVVDTNTDKKQSRARRFASDSVQQQPQKTNSQIAFLQRQRARVQKGEYFNGDFYIDTAPPDIIGTCMDVYKPFFRLTAVRI